MYQFLLHYQILYDDSVRQIPVSTYIFATVSPFDVLTRLRYFLLLSVRARLFPLAQSYARALSWPQKQNRLPTSQTETRIVYVFVSGDRLGNRERWVAVSRGDDALDINKSIRLYLIFRSPIDFTFRGCKFFQKIRQNRKVSVLILSIRLFS